MSPEEIEARIEAARLLSDHFDSVTPEELAWSDEGAMAVTWSDGRSASYEPEYLRSICPCAECRGTHGTPKKAFHILSAAQVQGADQETEIVGVEPVGHYALLFHWGDGHKDGIYAWSYLRAMSPDIGE
jgi:DUF971 family protein